DTGPVAHFVERIGAEVRDAEVVARQADLRAPRLDDAALLRPGGIGGAEGESRRRGDHGEREQGGEMACHRDIEPPSRTYRQAKSGRRPHGLVASDFSTSGDADCPCRPSLPRQRRDAELAAPASDEEVLSKLIADVLGAAGERPASARDGIADQAGVRVPEAVTTLVHRQAEVPGPGRIERP